jgi:hypothetical protein
LYRNFISKEIDLGSGIMMFFSVFFRPRARRRLAVKDLTVGDKLLVNYNSE